MPQSLYRNNLHIIFSTKYRQPFITENIEQELYDYLGGTCKKLGCNPIQVGGYIDHVHILCSLGKQIALMELLQKVKSSSSLWMKTNGEEFSNFYWQDGYGAFSVSQKELPKIENYILHQKEHHKNISFKNEFLTILRKNEILYDEIYLWD